MFNFLKKPSLKVHLVDGNATSKVTISNTTNEQAVIMLFTLVKQVALYIKVDHRGLLNKLKDLDTIMKRNAKRASKAK